MRKFWILLILATISATSLTTPIQTSNSDTIVSISIRFANYLSKKHNLKIWLKKSTLKTSAESYNFGLKPHLNSKYYPVESKNYTITFFLQVDGAKKKEFSITLETSWTYNVSATIFCYFSKDGGNILVKPEFDQKVIPFTTKNAFEGSSIWRLVVLTEGKNPYDRVTSLNSLCRDCKFRLRNKEVYDRYYKEMAHIRVSLKFESSSDSKKMVTQSFRFGSRGIYTVIIQEDESVIFYADVEASTYYLPLWLSFAFILLIWFFK